MLSLLGENFPQRRLTGFKHQGRRKVRRGSGRISNQSRTPQRFHSSQVRWDHARYQPAPIGDVDDLPRRSSLDDLRRVLLQRSHSNLIPRHVRQCST